MIKKIFLHSIAISCAALFSVAASAETLSDAIQKSLNYNPDVLFNRVHRHTTNEQLSQAKAAYFPEMDVSVGVGPEKANNPTGLFFTNNQALTLLHREASVNVVQHLFTGHHRQSEVDRNAANVRSAAYKLAGVANDIALNATEQYINVVKDQEIIKLAEDNLARHDSIFSMIQERTKSGVGKKADLDQATARLALAKTNVETAKSNYEDARIRYMYIVGSLPVNLQRPATPTFPWLPKQLNNGISIALASHPTLKSAWEDVEGSRQEHLSAMALNYPQLDLVLTASRNNNIAGVPGPNNDDLALLRANYNVFKGGETIAKQRETAFKIREALEVKDKTVVQIKQQLMLSWNALIYAQKRVVHIRQHADSAKLTYEAYGEQFKIGQRSLFDLLDAENEYFQTASELYNAEYDELYARYRILNSMGKLLPYTRVRLPYEAELTC